MGSFAMNVLAWNNYIEDSPSRSQNHAPAACCVWKALNQRVSAAASKQHKLSAAYSRIFMAARHSYPQQQAKDYVESLHNYIEDMFFVRKIVPQRLAVCGKP